MKVTPRDYQVRAMEACDQAEREGVRRPLVVHPTGTGKGVLMGALAARRADKGRTLVMVHRQELADQFIEKLSWQAPELQTGIVKAEKNELDAPVVIASTPTLAGAARLAQLVESGRRSPFGTILFDEAHLAPAPTPAAALRALGSYNAYGPLTIGLTATPGRDKKSLGVWERVVDYMSIREAIYRGFLCPILPALVVETKMDLARFKKRNGDLSDGDLGQELEDSGAIDQIADAYVQHATERKALAFTPTVKTAHLLARALRDRGVPAEALDGQTDKAERKAILARLRTGETTVVCNCGVLTTGFDEPSVDCVIIARPTTSHTLYVQMAGRGTRKSPGKNNLLLMDIVGASQRHDLISRVDLGDAEDEAKRKKRGDAEALACASCGVPCEVTWHRCSLCRRYLPAKVLSAGGHRHDNCQSGKAGQVDVFGESRLRWLPIGPGWCLGAGTEVVVMVPSGVDAWKLATYQNGNINVLHDAIPSDWATGIGEDRAKAFQKLVDRDARWLAGPISDQQKSRLVREGFPAAKLPLVRTKGEAADLVTRIQARRAVRRLGVTM